MDKEFDKEMYTEYGYRGTAELQLEKDRNQKLVEDNKKLVEDNKKLLQENEKLIDALRRAEEKLI